MNSPIRWRPRSFMASATPNNWTPTDTQITELESHIRLDQLAWWKISKLPSLSGYERFYAAGTSKGEKLILGELVLADSSKRRPGVHMVLSTREFPMISDGGCAVISLAYSVSSKSITSIKCNGRG